MSLLKLKSIFQEEAELRTEDFIDQRPQHSNDSRFEFNVPVVGMDFANKTSVNPILDSLLLPQSSLINFQQTTYDSRVPKNDGIKISNINSYKGSSLDNSGADNLFTNTANLGTDLSLSGGFEALYTHDHKPLPISSTPDPNNPFQPFNYGSNVDRGKLDIRANNAQFNLFSPSRTPLVGAGAFLGLTNDFAGEPYIVSPIGSVGRALNSSFPEIVAADATRIGKFLSSPQGADFILQQNFLGGNTKVQFPIVRQANPTTGLNPGPDANKFISIGVGQSNLRFGREYSPLSTLKTITQGQFGSLFNRATPPFGTLGLSNKTYPEFTFDTLTTEEGLSYASAGGDVTHDINKTFGAPSLPSEPLQLSLDSFIGGATPQELRTGEEVTGDKMTLAKMIKGTELAIADVNTWAVGYEDEFDDTSLGLLLDSKKDGMPFYFKDLRDDTYIFFRAYIEGLTENISPSWSETNYVGRSEPVYVYERATRDISFNLKLAAQTRSELTSIYQKLNRLTSLAYPQYDNDNYLGGNKVRMKPPLTKFRLGDLYGKTNDEMLGFIKSISYTIDNSSPYEIEAPSRVPHHINVALTYQVIHGTVPSLDTKFYGYVPEISPTGGTNNV